MKKAFIVTVLFISAMGCVSCDDDGGSSGNQPAAQTCGNGVREGTEVCDGADSLPRSCLAWDMSKKWREGGLPACAADCSAVVQGTCVEDTTVVPVVTCHNGVLDAGEKCDGEQGVPATCAELDPSAAWEAGGKPECSPDCHYVLVGSCKKSDVQPVQPGKSTDVNILETDEVTSQRCNLNSSDFEETCTGNVAHFCSSDGYVVNRDCDVLSETPGALTCQISVDGGYADCVETCSSTSASYPTTCTSNYITYHICEKAQSGGNYLYSYTAESPCPVACNGGQCVSNSAPVPGSNCVPSYGTMCFGGNAYECIDGKIKETKCAAGTACAMRFGEKTFQCAEKCSLYDIESSTFGCQTIGGKPALNNRVCMVATDAKYYWFKETDVCNTSCDDGVCDAVVPQPGSSCDPSAMNNMCAHNSVYYCDYTTNTVAVMTCGLGEFVGSPACRQRDAYFADCTFPCEPGTEPQMDCGGSNKKGTAYTNNTYCEQGLDGTYYYFNPQEACPNGCEKGFCL